MPKRKPNSDSEDDFEEQSARSSEEEASPPSPPPKAKPSKGKEKSKPVPTAKKPKVVMVEEASDTAAGDVTVQKGLDGDKYIDLGKKRHATVRKFKGSVYIDIREFYGNDGEEKPGKKGISLTVEQWTTLKKAIPTIDELCTALK